MSTASADRVDLYTATDFPVFQNRMFHSASAARNCTRGTVILAQDLASGLIFNRAFDPNLMQYDADYQNEQAVSTAFKEHLGSVAQLIRKHFDGNSLLEVGCGKGHFLEQLQRDGFQITGLDPTYEGTNPAVIKQYFTPASGLRAEGIVLRHVLEHVQNPIAFLSGIRDSNGGHGKIYIEVPCFDWICTHRAWFDVFYEHVNYFRLDDCKRMFGEVFAAGRTFGGQYLYIVAELASLQTPARKQQEALAFPADFLRSVNDHAARLRARPTRSSAIWGGASKGVIFALFMQRAGAPIDIVIDINPAKHGKFLPATGLQVSSPDAGLRLLAPGGDIVVMNSNYLDEIKQATDNRFNYLTVDHENL
jgi:SAM-dependent methyltransferase